MWKFVQLKDVCDLQNGYAFKSKDYVKFSNTLNCRMSNIRPDGVFDLDYNPKFLPDFYAEKYDRYLLYDGDVIIAMTDLATEAKILGVPTVVFTNGRNVLLNQRVGKLIIKKPDILYFPYLKYALNRKQVRNYYLRFAGGGLQINLGKNDLLSVEIPLPPIAEQKRIATILDKADTIRKKRQEAIKLTEELLRSQFLEMFGDPVINPKGWEIKPMNEVIENIQAGLSMKGEERKYEGDEWGVLKVSAVTSGRFKANEHKAVGNPNFTKSPIIPQKGDLLFSRANTRELVAATCLVENNYDRLFLPDKLWRIISNKKLATVEYLKFLLSDPKFRGLLARKATGTSGSMLNVSQAKLLEMNAPIPKLDIQKKFTVFVWKTFEFRKKQELALTELESLFNSLLQKVFKGEL